eukprot:COSAG06_NODE_1590_length_9000_cov_22.237951_3_plen_446_part_00
MVVLKNGVVVRHPAGPKSVVGVTPYSRTIRRVTRLLLRGARDSITFEELEAHYLKLCRGSLGETEDFAKVLDDDFKELKSAHEKGLPDNDPRSFRAQIRYLLEQLKPQRKKRSGVAAGPEDNRVLGICSTDTKRIMTSLRSKELQRQRVAVDALYKKDKKAALRGYMARANTAGQAEAISFLVARLKSMRSRTTEIFGNQANICIIAVHSWGLHMLGRAMRSLKETLDMDSWFLGDCTVVDRDMRRSRTSLHLSYHCLLRVFRERAERGAFSDNTRAREALADEIARTETPPAAIFVDALEFPLRYYDWAECSKVAELHFPIIVRVASRDAVPKGIPVLPAPAQGAAPRANITAILEEGRVPAVTNVESFHEKAQVVERTLARDEETHRPRDARAHGTTVPSGGTIRQRFERVEARREGMRRIDAPAPKKPATTATQRRGQMIIL